MRTTAILHPNGYRIALAHDYGGGGFLQGERIHPKPVGGRALVIDFEIAPGKLGEITFDARDAITLERVALNQRQTESVESHCRLMAPIIRAAMQSGAANVTE